MIAFDAFFAEFRDLFDWTAPDGGCVAYPRYRGNDGVEDFCKNLLADAGVILLPASLFRSELTDGPTDRFRIGVGRHHPEEALDAFAAWLRAR